MTDIPVVYRTFIDEMPENWQFVRFEELITEIRNGIYKKKEFHGSGVKIINMGELFSHDFISSQEMKLVELDEIEKEKYLVEDGDLLFARRSLVLEGSGKCSLVVQPIEQTTFESSIIRTRPNKEKIEPYYYFYFFKSSIGRALMASIASRTAVSGIRGSNLIELEVLYPPLETQRRIAAILSAYDDLIENNTRRIKALEQAAHDLYREWFVHFRFPGHESVEMVDSGTDYGMIPHGWEVKSVDDSFDILGGGTPSTKKPEYWEDGDIVWFSPSDLTAAGSMFIRDSSRHINKLGLQKSSAKMFPPYSVMMTSRATLGVTAINSVPACTNQGFITCIPNEKVSAYQIYFWIAENLEKIISVASGATFKEINKTTFRQFPFLIADSDVTNRFEEMVSSMGEQIENLLDRNNALREARDLLLPRLVSGQLDVSDIEVEAN
jgi:type I restriction enzyme, S subunit